MADIRLTVGQAVVKFLDNQYVAAEIDGVMTETKFVEGFYTIFGHGCVLGIGEALSMEKHSLKVYQGKNEQGMALAAASYAKTNNRLKIIPCVSSIGPGSANMVTAAATATVNNLPLLLFMGDSFASRQPDPVLQQVEQTYNPTVTTTDAFRAVTKFFDKVTRPEMIMTSLLNAMRVLTDPSECGAAAIAISQDVQGESYLYPESFFEKRVHLVRRRQPENYELQKACEKIKRSSFPLVVAGGGVRYSFAGNALKDFCLNHNIPFAETQAGKSAVESSFALNLGGIGVTGNACANTVAAKADLIIGVGTRFSDFTTSSKWLYPNAKVVTVNVSPFHAAKLDAVTVLGDAEATLRKLDELLGDYRSSYGGEISEAKKNWDKEYARLSAIEYSPDMTPENKIRTADCLENYVRNVGGTICQTSAIALIRNIIPSDAIAVGASGSLPGCLQRMWTTDALYSYNMEYGYSCMGYEIAGAVGSKMACPDKEVYAFAGDGSFNMLHSEMLTAVQEHLKINVLLFDNASFGCINNLQMGQGIDSLCTELRSRNGNNPIREGDFMNVDYAAVAAGYGFKSYTARTMKELEKSLKDSLKQTSPVLIDIKVLPKTMTDGYGSWWNVGVSEVPHGEKAENALAERKEKLSQARKY